MTKPHRRVGCGELAEGSSDWSSRCCWMRLELAGDHGPSVAAVCHRAADLLGEDPLCARQRQEPLARAWSVWPYVLTRAYPTIIADPLPAYCSGSRWSLHLHLSRRRVGLRGAQGNHRAGGDPRSREGSQFFSACPEPRPQDSVCLRDGQSPPAPHLQVRPFEPWCEPTRARCICVATCVCDFAASASRRRPLCPTKRPIERR